MSTKKPDIDPHYLGVDRGSFGPVLRRLRLEANLSQEELAERAHLSVDSISALERGRRRAPYRATIRMISNALDLGEAERRELEVAAHSGRTLSPATAYYNSTREVGNDYGALPTTVEPVHNLPLQRTELIGRATEIEAVLQLTQVARLVTITGVGGIGKTRTALAVGQVYIENTRADVFLAELAPVSYGSLVPATVAGALHVQEQAGRPLHESLIAHLKDKALLLIIDNCEHVIGDAAALAATLLQGCPKLTILATSRESLRIDGERTYRLPSLRVPDSNRALTLRAVESREYPAVALFAMRAQRSDDRFELDDRNAPIVAEICRRLDGIPLAIELAAARVNAMAPGELLAKLDQRFRILTSGDRTALPRQQTMRALIDWSYDLLAPAEQRLFERLSIFAGGCTLGPMTAVYGDDADELEVIELLSSLVAKSLVEAEFDVPEPRYRLLESSRKYATEKLTARGELAAIANRHAFAYADLAERLEREHDSERNSIWFARAELEIENWRAALHWTLIERGDTVMGQRLAGAMRAVWPAAAGAERRRWLQAALASVDEETPALIAANLEHAVATVAYMFGDFREALAGGSRLISVFGKLNDTIGVARAQFITGRSLTRLGRVAEAEAYLQASLETARALGNTPLAGLALAGLARSRSFEGKLDVAHALLAEARAIYEATGADAYSGLVESAAAEVEFRAGDFDAAVRLSNSSITALRSFGLTLFVTAELNALAIYFGACGRWADAAEVARDALALGQETQQLVEIAWALQHAAANAALAGTNDSGRNADPEIAAQVLGFVERRIAELGAVRQYAQQLEYDRAAAVLREILGEASFATLYADGAALTDEQAIAASRSLRG